MGLSSGMFSYSCEGHFILIALPRWVSWASMYTLVYTHLTSEKVTLLFSQWSILLRTWKRINKRGKIIHIIQSPNQKWPGEYNTSCNKYSKSRNRQA